MNMLRKVLVVSVLVSSFCACAAGLDRKTQRYYDILCKRPASSHIFDRFFNEWLKHDDIESLEKFLKSKADADNTDSGNLILAMFYQKEGRDTDALDSLNKAFKKVGANYDLLMMRANLELFNNDPEAAVKSAQEILKCKLTDTQKINAQKLLGKAYMAAGETQKAGELWKNLLKQSEDLQLREDVMELMLTEGLTEQALEVCKELLSQTRDSYKKVMLNLRLADIYKRLARNADSLSACKKALESVESGSWLEREILGRINKIYDSEGDAAGLLKYYDSLAKTRKGDITVMLERIKVLSKVEGTDQAISAYHKILEVTPGRRDLREKFAKFLLSANKPVAALKIMQTLVEKYPKDGQLWLDMAKLYKQLDNNEKAGEALKKYLACSDKSDSAYLRTARLMGVFGVKDGVGDILGEMLKKYPKSVVGREAMADYLYDSGKVKSAVDMLNAAAADAGVDTAIRCGEKLLDWKMPDDALKLFQKNADRFKKNSNYYMWLGRSATACKSYDKAMEYFRNELEYAGNFNEISQATAELLNAAKAAGKMDTLLKELQTKYQKTPGKFSDIDGCVLSQLYIVTNRQARAAELIDSLLKKHDNSIVLWTQSYMLSSKSNDYPASIRSLKKLLSLDPKRRGTLYRMMVDMALANGQKTHALQYVRDWMRSSGNTPEPWMAEARVYYTNGELTKALDILRSALRKFPDNKLIIEAQVNYSRMAGKYSDAGRILWRLFELASDTQERLSVVDRLAENAQISGNANKLIRNFEARQKSNPRSIFPLLALSRIYARTGDYDRQRQYMYKAFEFTSDDPTLLHEIAILEKQEGNYEQAVETLKKAVEIDKTLASQDKLIEMYFAVGEDEKAYAMLMARARENVSDPAQAEKLLSMLLVADQLEQANKMARKFVKQFKDDYRLKYFQAVLLRISDQNEKAADVFVELLDCDKELPRVTAAMKKIKNPGNGISKLYQRIQKKMLPGDLMNFQRVMHDNGQIQINHGYGRGRGAYYSSMSIYSSRSAPSLAQTAVYLPQNIDDVTWRSWGQLKGIYRSLTEAQQKEFVKKLTDKGYDNTKIFLTYNPRSNNRAEQLIELSKEFPENEMVQFFILTNSQNDSSVTPEQFIGYCKKISGKHPLACFFPLTYYMRKNNSPELQKELDSLMALVSKEIDKDPDVAVLIMMNGYGISHLLLDDKMPKEQKDRIRAFLKKCVDVTEKSNEPLVRFSAGARYTQMLLQGGNYKDAFKTINKLLKTPASVLAGVYGGVGMPRYGSSMPVGFMNPRYMDLNRFPPQLNPRHSISILQHLGQMSGMLNMVNIQTDEQKAEYAKALDTLDSPMLRLSFARRLSTEFADKQAAEIIKNEKADADDLLTAAFWYASRQKHEKAAELFQKAYEKARKNEVRQQAIVALIWMLDKNYKLPEEYRKFVVKNIDKFQPKVNNPREYKYFIDLFRKLGCEAQAKKYERLARAARPTTRPARITLAPPHTRRHTNPYRVDTNELNKLTRKGKKATAAKLLAKVFRRCCPSAVMSGQIRTHEMNQVIQMVKSYRLEKEFLDQFKLSDQPSMRSLRERAMALEKLGKDKLAFEAYQEMLKKRPKDIWANMYMVGHYAGSDPEKVRKYIKAITKGQDMNYVGQKINEIFNQKYEIDQRITMLNIITELAESLEDGVTNAYWIQNIISNAQHVRYKNRQYYGFFNTRRDAERFEKSNIPADLRKKYISAVIHLCDVYAVKGGNLMAFQTRQRISHFLGGDDKDISELAKQVLLGGSNQHQPIHYYYSSSRNSGHEFTPDTPMSYLLKQSIKTKDWSDFDEIIAIYGKSSNNNKIAAAKKYNLLKAIYVSPADQRKEKRKEFINAIDMSNSSDMPVLMEMIALWNPAKDESLTPDIKAFVDRACKGNHRYAIDTLPRLINVWTTELAKNNKNEELVSFLAGLEKSMITKGDIQRLNKLAKTGNYFISNHNNTSDQKARAFLNTMHQMMFNHKAAFSRAIAFYQARPYLQDQHFKNLLSNITNDWFSSTGGFLNSPMVGDLDTVASTADLISAGLTSMGHRVMHNRGLRNGYFVALQKSKKSTFGADLMKVILKPTHAGKVDLVKKYLAKISALPPAKRAAIAGLLFETGVMDINSDSFSAEQKTEFAALTKSAKDTFLKKIKEHVTANCNNYYPYMQETARLLKRSSTLAPDKFDFIMLESIKNIEKNPNVFGTNSPSSRRDTIISQLLSQYSNVNRNDFDSMAALVKFFKKPENAKYVNGNAIQNYVRYRLREGMQHKYNQLRENNKGSDGELIAIKSLLSDFEKKVGANGMEFLLMNDVNFINSGRGKILASNWLDKMAVETKNQNWLRYKIATDNDYNRRRMLACKFAADTLDDKSLSQTWRVANAYMILQQNSNRSHTKGLIQALAKMYACDDTPGDFQWQILYVFSDPSIKLKPATLEKLNKMAKEKYNQALANKRSRNPQDIVAFMVIAAEAGDWDQAKRLLADRVYRYNMGNNQYYYPAQQPDVYFALAKYPQLRQVLLDHLNANAKKMNTNHLNTANCISDENIKALFDLLGHEKASPDTRKSKLAFAALLRRYMRNKRIGDLSVEDVYKDALADYRKNMKGKPEEYMELVGYLGYQVSNDREIAKEFVEHVPLSVAFAPHVSMNQQNILTNLYSNYLNNAMRSGGDFKTVKKLLAQLDKMPANPRYPHIKNNLVNNMVSRVADKISNYHGSIQDAWAFAPEQYLEIYKQYKNSLRTDQYYFYRFTVSAGILAYMLGDDKQAKEILEYSNNARRFDGNSPAYMAVSVYLNMLIYEGKRKEPELIKRLLALPDFYDFAKYYKGKNTDFRRDFAKCLMNRNETRKYGKILGEKHIAKVLEEFKKSPSPENYRYIRDYYNTLRGHRPPFDDVYAVISEKLPNDWEMAYNAASYYCSGHKWKEFKKIYDHYTKLWPERVDFYALRAQSFSQRKMYKQAAEYLMDASGKLKNLGSQQYLLWLAADNYEKLAQYQKAIECCERIKQLNTNGSRRYNNRQIDKRITNLRAIKNISPDKSKKDKITPSSQPTSRPTSRPTTQPTRVRLRTPALRRSMPTTYPTLPVIVVPTSGIVVRMQGAA